MTLSACTWNRNIIDLFDMSYVSAVADPGFSRWGTPIPGVCSFC